MKRYLFVLLFLGFSYMSFPQGLKVVKVEETVSGSYAFHAPVDESGHPCGLVKIKSTFTDLSFKGEVIGDIQNNTNEYFVYLKKGASQLIVSRPNVLPVIINFPDYGILGIESKATYNVEMKELSLNSRKNSISIEVKPYTAKIYIDNAIVNSQTGNSGRYQLLLPKGDHLCRIEANGYTSYAQHFKTGKEPVTIVVELESLMADVEITSATTTAELFVNGEKKGNGSWKGKLPAGSVTIEAKQEGYVPFSQTVILEEKGQRLIPIPELQREQSVLLLKVTPHSGQIIIDGKQIQDTLLMVNTGIHKLEISAYGCVPIVKEINVVGNTTNECVYNLEYKNDLYKRAYRDDLESMMLVANNSITSWKNPQIEEGKYWLYRIFDLLDKTDVSFLNRSFLPSENEITCSYEGEKNYVVLFWLYSLSNVGEFEKALSIIDKVQILQNDFNARLCYDIAECYYKTQKSEQAIIWYNRCLERDDDNGIASLTEKCNHRIKELCQKKW